MNSLIEALYEKPLTEMTDEELEEIAGPPVGYCQCGCEQKRYYR